MKRNFYGDESGSITKYRNYKNRYFIIGFISPADHLEISKIERTFRKSKVKYLNNNPHVNLDVTKEIKGSEMNLDMKKFILRELIRKHSITFHYAIIDNYKLYPKLQSEPHITFNYLINTYFCDNHRTGITDLRLKLDDRNKAIAKLRDLENYLQTNLFVNTDIQQVSVKYHLSHNVELIQIADIFCNLIYRYSTYFMNAKKPIPLEIKTDYHNFFQEISPYIECYTSFPRNRSGYNCPHFYLKKIRSK